MMGDHITLVLALCECQTQLLYIKIKVTAFLLLYLMLREKNYPICQSPCAFRLGGRGGNRTPIESDNA